ncbi:hypothetical protein TRIUR3_25215 [Triticum urartu]|uniref:Uncharacterized protein n=1 Tax=Triticum urartu TaxID=4572 RepID=M8APT0_TRIUA|nr:hypothetical protein TRIUR3_25215 [Triticum urartu]
MSAEQQQPNRSGKVFQILGVYPFQQSGGSIVHPYSQKLIIWTYMFAMFASCLHIPNDSLPKFVSFKMVFLTNYSVVLDFTVMYRPPLGKLIKVYLGCSLHKLGLDYTDLCQIYLLDRSIALYARGCNAMFFNACIMCTLEP